MSTANQIRIRTEIKEANTANSKKVNALLISDESELHIKGGMIKLEEERLATIETIKTATA
jgi:hypothetical protein